MKMVWLVLLSLLLLFFFLILFWIYEQAFLGGKKRCSEDLGLPSGKEYDPYRAELQKNVLAMQQHAFAVWQIKANDGVNLSARYYENVPGAPVIILVHGYKSSSFRDASGGFHMVRKLGFNSLVVDLRAHGESGGHTISFGIKEKEDLILWAEEVQKRLGKETPVAFSGISMGAATALMAGGDARLPACVKCIVADCPYSSPQEILRSELKKRHLPEFVYHLMRISARLIGRFDPSSDSPMAALERCPIPVLLIHGMADDFVPFSMSKKMAEETKNEDLIFFPVAGAGHGLSIYLAPEEYVKTYCAFMAKHLQQK